MNQSVLLAIISGRTWPPPTTIGDSQRYLSTKSVGVDGILLCGKRPLVNTTVSLVAMSTRTTDEQVFATAITNKQGLFEAFGSVKAGVRFQASVKFSHSCKNGVIVKPKKCLLTVAWKVPDDYVTRSINIHRWFNHRYTIKPTDVGHVQSESGTCK